MHELENQVHSHQDYLSLNVFDLETDSIKIQFTKHALQDYIGSRRNILFDEIEDATIALADMELSNKAGHIANVRFKLDSGSGANLLLLHGIFVIISTKETLRTS